MPSEKKNSFPTDIHRSFVSSFYGNLLTSYFGIGVILITVLVIYVKTGQAFFLAMAAAFSVVSAYRMIWFSRFRATTADHELNEHEIALFERHYLIGSSAVALILGLVTCYALGVSGDVFAELASVNLTLACMVSVVGRNYGSGRAVLLLTILACGPMGIGFLMEGGPYMAFMGGLLLPFALTILSMAKGVREFLFRTCWPVATSPS